MFPVTDSSQTIIDCLVQEAEKNKVKILLNENALEIKKVDSQWHVKTSSGQHVFDKILVATGSSPMVWEMLEKTGHTIIDPVPSLFTFIIKHPVLTDLPGISVPNASVQIHNTQTSCEGPLLITHVGLSGPAVLKLSAFGALDFSKTEYKTRLILDFTGHGKDYVSGAIKETREAWGSKKVKNSPLFNLPQRLWNNIIEFAGIGEKNWADLNRKTLDNLVASISSLELETSGKNTFKEEFVTAGGVDLSEVNMKTMESKKAEGLYFAGEVLNIDAVTGGFNFQAAWTTGYLAAKGMGEGSR